ncbi:glycosyltransferase involved in cell wall biosynthesis [Pseudoduganella lurida]|uniref:Glycosyltransferase involved in cell wall biosynthesis n=1 Tax=Pseudoduganella lurida TaxID=1036180 RepID=A0A562RDT7_9BURK|nr:glycosyltransferase [Pseudoduganella lurida]TWI67257.1 glycosyltransferase involved in cell wall biosynthesis [Pseudoduganella lurida]
MSTIIVFCHLRWDFVFQRPQHLLTRLAKHYNIVLVEEPIHHDGESFMKKWNPAPNITVCQPHTPVHQWGFHDDQIPLLQPMVAELVPEGEDPIVWFYTPMALPLLPQLHASLVIYDCMDELSAFKNPPRQLLQRESALLSIADLVFTGGPSLYEAKRTRHANAHCFSSSVDAKHFAHALDRSASHPDQEHIPHPRLGFYGVIDERFDLDMAAAVADAHPEWQIVLVGPVVKIDPAHLPQRTNIHYMGQRTYDELPKFLAGWDVAMMPFALNEATKFISPTKVLEYMAAELPIVSTPIKDVVQPYGHVVAIGHSAAKFVAHCEAALAQTPEQTAEMVQKMRDVVANTSWEKTAERMRELIETTEPSRNFARLTTPEDLSYGVTSEKVSPLPTPASGAALAPATSQKLSAATAGAGTAG